MGVVAAGILGFGGYGAYNILHALTDTGGSSGTSIGTVGGAPSTSQATDLAHKFLDDWSAGRDDQAGSETDSPQTAQSALDAYRSDLGVQSLTFGQVSAEAGGDTDHPSDVRVSFQASLKLGSGIGAWSYDGRLDITNDAGQARVRWDNDVLYPGLKDSEKLIAGSIPASGTEITDRHGTVLDTTADPSLGPIVSALSDKYAGQLNGTPGKGIAVVAAESSNGQGSAVTKRVLKSVTQPKPATLRTTLDASLQAAAEKAVRLPELKGLPTALVAIDPSDGQIRAVADPSGTTALTGHIAPGSTFKLITSAALLDKGGLSTSSPATCTPTVMVNGETFHNVDNESASGSTLARDFEMSCNTAFIRLADNHLGMTDIKDEADGVFGLDGNWQVGVPTPDGAVPDPGGSRNERAGDAIGQGQVAVSPLTMASVTATVASGTFRQPVLLPSLPQTPAARSLSPSAAAAIRSMMRGTAQYGTAAPRLSGFSGVGAKTGTAEVGDGTNGWFVAYDSRIAVAAVTLGGHTGADSAGYAVKSLLSSDG
ncbi:penicillin-binding transpeptidase domain-containing protein [Phaeacidiphilus oryzae]|uniref:penicillin-binding transpeptidase domain-containing protein n=1 Tax=Phaeacidiphilus oryzae TaxID=348818 RepID=UPI00069012FE|nr:penicillin-binding transpeptidase domain-containing protein [Phaeacidiphilus oryzae]